MSEINLPPYKDKKPSWIKNGSTLTLKDLTAIAALLSLIVTALGVVLNMMFFSESDGVAVRSNLLRHVDKADPQIAELKAKAKELEARDDMLIDTLHRMEIRQVEDASPKVRRKFPLPARRSRP